MNSRRFWTQRSVIEYMGYAFLVRRPTVAHSGNRFGLLSTPTLQPLLFGQQGRLNQWAHWARAQGPGFFYLCEGPPTGCGEIKLIILLLMLLHDRTNSSSAYLVNLT